MSKDVGGCSAVRLKQTVVKTPFFGVPLDFRFPKIGGALTFWRMPPSQLAVDKKWLERSDRVSVRGIIYPLFTS